MNFVSEDRELLHSGKLSRRLPLDGGSSYTTSHVVLWSDRLLICHNHFDPEVCSIHDDCVTVAV